MTNHLLSLTAAIMVLGGLVIGLWSLNYVTSGNFPLSKPFWRTGSDFTRTGFRLYFSGWVLFPLGDLLMAFYFLHQCQVPENHPNLL